jgi:hypothetical protein
VLTVLSKEGVEPLAKDVGVWPRETEPETSGGIAAATAVRSFEVEERLRRRRS